MLFRSDACFAQFIPNVKKPGPANCARERAAVQARCAPRNAIYAKCLEEPLGYFLCLNLQGKAPERKP